MKKRRFVRRIKNGIRRKAKAVYYAIKKRLTKIVRLFKKGVKVVW